MPNSLSTHIIPAVEFNKLFCQCKPKPGACILSGIYRLKLRKLFKELRHIFSLYADAGVCDRDFDEISVSGWVLGFGVQIFSTNP